MIVLRKGNGNVRIVWTIVWNLAGGLSTVALFEGARAIGGNAVGFVSAFLYLVILVVLTNLIWNR